MKRTLQNYYPRDYQRYAEQFIIEHDQAGLFLDMGLGKTVVTLTALSKISWDWEHILIVAPKRPALDTWPEELAKWKHLKEWDPSVEIAVGTRQQREQAVQKRADITIINRENIPWLVNYLKGFWYFDTVVIDELSSFKSSKAQRFRALKKVRPKIRRVIGLTGTPMSNGYMDLWAECYLIDQGAALGRTITGYRDRYFTPGRRNGHIIYEWNLRDGAADEIVGRIKPFCVMMKTEDYLELPELVTIERRFTLSPKAMKRYREMEKNQLLEVDESEIDAVNAAALTRKLQQISSGEVYDDEKNVVRIHDEKIEALTDLVEELEGEHCFVLYQYKHERARILEAFPDAVDIREPDAIKRWRSGEIDMLIAHPAAAGHGLNLQAGGSVVIWYSLPTSLELYQQSVKRLHRSGQEKRVRNIVLMAKGTYDEVIYGQVLTRKEKRQDAMMEALKTRIREVKDGR